MKKEKIMEITLEYLNPPTLAVKDAKSTTLAFDAFYSFSGKGYESRQGKTGKFGELPSHIRENARAAFGGTFKTYKILRTDELPKTRIQGGGSIAFYNELKRSDFRPGDRIMNKISWAVGTVLGGKDGKLKEPCNKEKIAVRCFIQKGKNSGKPRISYWVIENLELVD